MDLKMLGNACFAISIFISQPLDYCQQRFLCLVDKRRADHDRMTDDMRMWDNQSQVSNEKDVLVQEKQVKRKRKKKTIYDVYTVLQTKRVHFSDGKELLFEGKKPPETTS